MPKPQLSEEKRKELMLIVLKEQWDNALNSITEYHVHIYHNEDPNSYEDAEFLSWKIQNLFENDIIEHSQEGATGPHFLPNFVLTIRPESFQRITQWLQFNHGDLSVALHPHTGDVIKDHRDRFLWFGKQLGINPKFIEKHEKRRKEAATKQNKLV